jgi:hypothetical protein
MSHWNKLIRPAQKRFRRSRIRLIGKLFPEIEGSVVVDVGGSLHFWREAMSILKPSRVLIYNISAPRMTMLVTDPDPRIEAHLYDGVRLPLADNEADFVLCNSVIEHVRPDARASFAAEIQRVGKRFAVQTPSRSFPFELHFGMPFVHWLPRRLGRWLVGFSPFQLLSGANARKYFDATQLLSTAELRGHFPTARIITEDFLGMPESMLAVQSE